MVGGHARVRRTFNCSKLLEELLLNHKVEVEDSPSWGITAYKEAVKREFHILSVPATELSGDIDKLFYGLNFMRTHLLIIRTLNLKT